MSLCIPGWPGTHYVDQTYLKLTVIALPVSPSTGIKGIHYHTWFIRYFTIATGNKQRHHVFKISSQQHLDCCLIKELCVVAKPRWYISVYLCQVQIIKLVGVHEEMMKWLVTSSGKHVLSS